MSFSYCKAFHVRLFIFVARRAVPLHLQVSCYPRDAVSLYLCIRHRPVLYRNCCTDRISFLACILSLIYSTMSHKKIWLFPKVRTLPSWTLSQTLDWKFFCQSTSTASQTVGRRHHWLCGCTLPILPQSIWQWTEQNRTRRLTMLLLPRRPTWVMSAWMDDVDWCRRGCVVNSRPTTVACWSHSASSFVYTTQCSASRGSVCISGGLFYLSYM